MSRITSTLVGVLIGLLAPAAALSQGARADAAEVARLIVEQTNEFRQAAHIGKTQPDAKLMQTARDFAEFMARTDRYGHEADGKDAAQRASAHGYDHCLVSENIAFMQSSDGFGSHELARGLVDGWEKSAGHRKNMLDADAVGTGVAVAQSARTSRYYAVQMFGRPRTMTLEFRIANESGDAVRYELDGKSILLPARSTHIHQRCRPSRLSLRLPGQDKTMSVVPAQGDRYVIVRNGSQGFVLKKG